MGPCVPAEKLSERALRHVEADQVPSAAFIAFAVAFVAVRVLASGKLGPRTLDVPNERSLHRVPVPRTGGLGVLAGAAAAWLAVGGGALTLVFGFALALSAVSLADDVRGLSVRVRFLAQAVAAAIFLAAHGFEPVWLMPIALLGILWSTNLYNFMDGSDGLAGGMAVIGFAGYAIAASAAGASDIGLCAAIVAGASAGFLVWNFPPARIFMGDAGSIPLGFTAACLGIVGWQRGVWPFWFPALVFSPFILDATVTLVRRWLRGEKLSQAHRSHYYQRLNQTGFGHRGTALAEYALMAAAAGSALWMRTASVTQVASTLLAWAIVYTAMALWIDRRWAACQGLHGRADSSQTTPAPPDRQR